MCRSRFTLPSAPAKHSVIGSLVAPVLVVSLLLIAILPASAAPLRKPTAPFATTIIVDTSEDLTPGSINTTCMYAATGFGPAADGKCTLRRAIVEASLRPQGDRPIAINFNLANNDPNKDLEVAGTWTLPIEEALPPLERTNSLDINGQVTIDGATQPGGRTGAPIIIVDTKDHSLEVESTDNVIRNMAFKGGGVIFLKEDGNLVEYIWMGLSDDGQSIVFRTPGQPIRMAGGGVVISADNNTVRDSVISGAFARALRVDGGDDNLIENNLVGTRSDGTVPDVPSAKVCERATSLDPQNWYGGWGIEISGSRNQVSGNRIAGLHIVQSENDTPPLAIEIFGADHVIENNVIGLDSTGKKVGVCGQGIKVAGSGTSILDNTVVRSQTGFEDGEETAILANDTSPLFGQITVRGNIVEDGPGKIFEFGPGIPTLLRTFGPAKITDINGTAVSGTNGDGSPCPGCLIDLYRDDDDAIGEALEFLGSATAASDGAFSLNLAQPLPAGMGIRTSSTSQSPSVIGTYGAGTTTRVSKLYLGIAELELELAGAGEINVSNPVTATVLPANATPPFDYTVEATDKDLQEVNGAQGNVLTGSLTWDTPGVKTVKVTVENELGSISASKSITITGSSASSQGVFLPFVLR